MSRELIDIETGLRDGLVAAEGMRARSTHWSGREEADRCMSSIRQGLAAYEKLRRDLRDGRKHIDMPHAEQERGPVAANLTKADDGCRLCDTCEGVGVTMIATCEAGYHAERDVACPDCDGEGQVEVTS
jgi:hypothetical protein